MSSKAQLREEIIKKAVVHGKVILSSGKEADYYVDLRRVTLDHVAAPLIGEVMLDLTKEWDYEAVGGLTLGADPVATAMMHVATKQGKKLDAFVVRKAEKAHGLQRRIEGPDVKGKRVLAVEDTSTTGGSVLTAVEALKEAGAIVVGVAVIVERGAAPKIKEAGLEYRAAYQLADLGLNQLKLRRVLISFITSIITGIKLKKIIPPIIGKRYLSTDPEILSPKKIPRPITDWVQITAPMQLYMKNLRGGILMMPASGLISVLTKGTQRAKIKALPVPYLFNHFSVA